MGFLSTPAHHKDHTAGPATYGVLLYIGFARGVSHMVSGLLWQTVLHTIDLLALVPPKQ